MLKFKACESCARENLRVSVRVISIVCMLTYFCTYIAISRPVL